MKTFPIISFNGLLVFFQNMLLPSNLFCTFYIKDIPMKKILKLFQKSTRKKTDFYFAFFEGISLLEENL
jgi:hypothetical protein